MASDCGIPSVEEQAEFKERHQKNREVLFANEALVITVMQALSGGAVAASLAGWDDLSLIVGSAQLLAFLVTLEVSLGASVLAAYWKHEYKKWDVKSAHERIESWGETDETKRLKMVEETGRRIGKAGDYLTCMRRALAVTTWSFSIALAEIPVFIWLENYCNA